MNFILATPNDQSYLLELRKATMNSHLENEGIFLSEEEHVSRLMEQFDCSYLLQENGNRLGTVKFKETEEAIELMQLQIEPALQNKGIGRRVIEQLAADAKQANKNLVLTVLKKNPALRLYLRQGFNIVGEDEYEYFMRLELSTGPVAR